MITKYDLLVAGEINPDLILTGEVDPAFGQVEKLVENASLTIGSSSVILACGAARLGLSVVFIGVTGKDIFGEYMLSAMDAHGIDVSPVIQDPAQNTGLSVILNRGTDRAILTYAGSMTALRADQVTDDLLKKARHLHIASYFLQTELQPGLPGLFQRARDLGLSTSLDTNWDPSGEWHGFDQLLSLVDVFLPNEREALALTSVSSVEAALAQLSLSSPVVAIKMGERGAVARRAREVVQVPALSTAVVDTIGAGDSFDAGFIYGYLSNWDLERCLHLAVVCGSLSTRAAGGTTAQPTLQEALQFL